MDVPDYRIYPITHIRSILVIQNFVSRAVDRLALLSFGTRTTTITQFSHNSSNLDSYSPDPSGLSTAYQLSITHLIKGVARSSTVRLQNKV